jgi:hypothetical protein
MTIPIPYNMRDTEPAVMRLGPPLRVLPPPGPSATDYDPWFDLKQLHEEELAKKRRPKKKAGGDRSMCPMDLAERGKVTNYMKQLPLGAAVWAWAECMGFNPDTCIRIGEKPYYPYAGYIISKDIIAQTCCIRFESGVTSPAVPFDLIRISNPLVVP